MTSVRVSLVDLYVLRGAGPALECLVLRRRARRPLPGLVGGGARPHRAGGDARPRRRGGSWRRRRDWRAERLYNLSRVETFYQHRLDEVALVPVFAAFVAAGRGRPAPAPSTTGSSGSRRPRRARRFAWPREGARWTTWWPCWAAGDGGAVEDVLRVC